ncbi:MAG: AraC family transcriptional regulator, partial [Bacteroidota bacterium]
MAKKAIPLFKDINDLHQVTGYHHRTHLPNFDIFTMESLDPTCARCMPPYKQDYYQISILSRPGNSKINLNTDSVELTEMPFWVVVPGQVFSWVRSENISGYQLYFKLDFLPNAFADFLEEFPYFQLTETN